MPNTIKIGHLNLRSGKGKWEDLDHLLNEQDMEIFGVTETHLKGRVEKELEHYSLLGKGREKWIKQGGGVGILVRRDSDWQIEVLDTQSGEKEAEDVMGVSLTKNDHKIVIIICYMSTERNENYRENVVKYRAVRSLVEANVDEEIIIMGDMNGHVGIMDEPLNRNGEMCLEFCERHDMTILNRIWCEYTPTFRQENRTSAIDLMMVNRRALDRATRMIVDEERNLDFPSDHDAIIMWYRTGRRQREREE